MRTFLLSVVLGVAAFGFVAVPQVSAQFFHPQQRFYAPGSNPYFGAYFGQGHHDVRPHWHQTITPGGQVKHWYGLGSHDFRPHMHTYTPHSRVGHHHTPWGYTQSFHPRRTPFFRQPFYHHGLYGW